MSARRLFAIARKEALQLRRDPRSLVLAFILPLFQLVFFGYAITLDVDDIPIAVLDQDRSAASRELIAALGAAGFFHVAEYLDAYSAIDDRLTRGDVTAALVVPPGFQRDLDSGRSASVQLAVDGTDANTATIALGYAEAILARQSIRVVADGRRISPIITADTRVWYNPELRSRNMIVPGLIAVIMSIIAALLTALTIAREWERGTMEQLAATPVHPLEVVLGKLLPYIAIGFIDMIMIIVAGMLLFSVPLRGDVPASHSSASQCVDKD